MRRPLAVLALLLAPAGLRAQEAETPILVFREADADTAREITRELTSKGLGDHVPLKRLEARERLARIGPWSVPFLSEALAAGKGSARIRMNAALSLAILRDPRGLDPLRRAAAADDDPWVRRAATLAIGLFRSEPDVDTLRQLLASPRVGPRCAAPALAKLRHENAAAILAASARPDVLPKSEHDRAAVLLAATIAAPGIPLVEHLEDERGLVQEAAATGLTLRPLPADRTGEILAVLRRSRLTGAARVIVIRALGAIEPRPDAVHAALLEIARRDGAADERIAALVELAGRAEDFDTLRRAYRLLQGRNDPVVAALLFAMARTRQGEAFDDLLGLMRASSPFVRFYAGASLLYVSALDEALETETRLRFVAAVGSLMGERDAYLNKLGEAANHLKWELQKPTLAEAARSEFRKLGDPRDLRLFIWTREERTWREVNRLLARILQLDQVLTQFDSARPGRTAEPVMGGGEGGGEEGRKAPSGSNEEQDLFDLLLPPPPPAAPKGEPGYPERPPYFGPEDLGG